MRRFKLTRTPTTKLASPILPVAGTRSGNTLAIQLIQADAMQLPLAPKSADYVISSLFLHHFTAPQAIDVLRSAYHAAAHGIIMSDAVRGWAPLVMWKLGEP